MASKSLGTVGKANLNIVPKFDNLGSTIKKTLDGIDTSSSGSAGGSAYGESFTVGMGSMLGGGAIAGVMASITSEVTSILSDAVMGAVQRSDILANYPKQMANLGFSTDEATESIETMSDRLTGLPTSLSDMASVVTGIAAITGDLDLSTEAGLALNDMLLASGSSTTLTSAAMEQFRQILAKGKPDMQDWKSLTQTMPGQMDQLAEAMLGAGANSQDLYEALGGGGHDATISTTDLLNAMVKLDQEGSEGMVSFRDQAIDATGGIETSMDNMEIAIERGIAGVIDSIGRENITGVITGIGDTFEGALDVVGGAIETCRPLIDAFIGAIEAIAPYAEPAIVALGGFATLSFGVSEGVGALSKIIGETEHIFGPASTMAGKLSDAFFDLAENAEKSGGNAEGFLNVATAFSGAEGGALVAGIGAIITAVAIVATTFYDAWEKEEAYKKSTEGLKDATEKATGPISAMSDAYESVMGTADKTTTSVANLKQEMQDSVDATNDMVDAINDRTNETATSVGLLESYAGIIEEYANHADNDEVAQEKLKWAIDQVNDACGTQYEVTDAVNGKIEDETGTVMDNTDAIIDNIKQKEKQLKVEALSEDYKDVYKQQYEDLQELQKATDTYNEALDKYNTACQENMESGAHTADELDRLWQDVQDSEIIMDEWQVKVDSGQESLDNLAGAMFELDSGTQVITTSFQNMGIDVEGILEGMGTNMDEFSQNLEDAGVSSSTMTNLTADEFQKMVDKCGGDVDKLIRKLKEYNDTHLDEKEAYVYTNGYDVNKQREEWNKGTWYPKRADVTITSSGITTGPLTNNAAGGIRLDAEGGIVPYAGIATSAVPLDIVGEAGAEAIVPLTNRQYSLPFAQLIAEEIGELEGTGNTVYNNNYYLDGIQITGSDADELETLLGKYVTMGAY